MPNAWICDNCGEVRLSTQPATKIIVSIKPRDYVADLTFCSLRCLDEKRDELQDDLVHAYEMNGD